MTTRTSDRVYAGLGITFVVTLMAGVLLSPDLHGGPDLNASDAQYAASIAHPIATINWVGAYLEMISVGCFLAFAVWAISRLGHGPLAQLSRIAAGAYAAVTVASLGLFDAIGYRHGHGLTVPVARTLDAVNVGVYVGTWFLTAFFLAFTGALALHSGRRLIGWSAIAIAVVTLAAAPAFNGLGQMTSSLFFLWIIATSVALARSPARRTAVNTLPARQAA